VASVLDHPTVAIPEEAAATGGRPRVAYYSHDTYGLGHLRRTLKVAAHVRQHWPDASQLVVTGSPFAHGFPMPPGADYIKLPSVVKTGRDRYVARSLGLDFEAIRDLRSQLLADAVDRFRPDAFIVDHAPAGMAGEALRALGLMKDHFPASSVVLGLRDIVDDPAVVRRAWRTANVYALLDDVYDLIVVYGLRNICDVAVEYQLSPRAADKVRYVGYLSGTTRSGLPPNVRSDLGLRTDHLVVVTAGGGGDGYHLLRALAEGLAIVDGPLPFDCVAISGPLMAKSQRDELRAALRGHAGVHYLDFVDDLAAHLAAADLVVSMGGYNTVCEVLDSGRPALIVPRTQPRREQLIRAEALARRGLVSILHPKQLSPQGLMSEIARLLREPTPAGPRPRMTGFDTLAAELATVISPRLPIGAAGSAP
jgi:predicted glycosyltransferase